MVTSRVKLKSPNKHTPIPVYTGPLGELIVFAGSSMEELLFIQYSEVSLVRRS